MRGEKKELQTEAERGDRAAIVELRATDVESGSNGLGQMSVCLRCVALTFAVVCGVLLLLIVGAQDLLLRLWGPCRLRGRRRGRRGRRGGHRGFLLGLRPANTTVG